MTAARWYIVTMDGDPADELRTSYRTKREALAEAQCRTFGKSQRLCQGLYQVSTTDETSLAVTQYIGTKAALIRNGFEIFEHEGKKRRNRNE